MFLSDFLNAFANLIIVWFRFQIINWQFIWLELVGYFIAWANTVPLIVWIFYKKFSFFCFDLTNSLISNFSIFVLILWIGFLRSISLGWLVYFLTRSQRLYENNNIRGSENKRKLHRRDSLPPLTTSHTIKSQQQNLATKYYQKWRENKFPKKPKTKKSKHATEHPVDDVIIEEGSGKLLLQKNVTFSPEFEQVFKDLALARD